MRLVDVSYSGKGWRPNDLRTGLSLKQTKKVALVWGHVLFEFAMKVEMQMMVMMLGLCECGTGVLVTKVVFED